MHGIERIEDHGGRSGAGQSGGDFVADMARFPHPANDDFSAVGQGVHHQADGPSEGLAIKAIGHTTQFVGFGADDFAGLG